MGGSQTDSLIELTVPFQSNITDAHKIKIDRYKALVQDFNETDYDTTYEAIEVGQSPGGGGVLT